MSKDTGKPILIIGLGNPGKEYYWTRHSAGFMVVDELAKKHNLGDFGMVEDNTMVCAGKIGQKMVILAKPQTFMNKSGYSAKRMQKHYSLFKDKKFDNLWVVNDDCDIPFGKIKISKNHGSAGHKGVQSIIDQMKTRDFARFRVGIQPESETEKKIPAERFVLKKITESEQGEFIKAAQTAAEAIEMAVNEGIEKAMTKYN